MIKPERCTKLLATKKGPAKAYFVGLGLQENSIFLLICGVVYSIAYTVYVVLIIGVSRYFVMRQGVILGVGYVQAKSALAFCIGKPACFVGLFFGLPCNVPGPP